MFSACTETVSILYALIFGAGDACIELSTASVLSAFGAFMVLVVIAQFFARKLWQKLTAVPDPIEDSVPEPYRDTPFQDDPKYRDTAIRSSKR